jgi:hypothetical protein
VVAAAGDNWLRNKLFNDSREDAPAWRGSGSSGAIPDADQNRATVSHPTSSATTTLSSCVYLFPEARQRPSEWQTASSPRRAREGNTDGNVLGGRLLHGL